MRSLTLIIIIILILIIGLATAFLLIRNMSSQTTTPSSGSWSYPPNNIPNGVYMWSWDKEIFERVNVSGGNPYIPKEDGYYLYYFHNNQCPHCQSFEPKLISFLKDPQNTRDIKDKIKIILVVCNWFTIDCADSTAKATYTWYNVMSSPTFLLIEVKNGVVVKNIDISSLYVSLVDQGKIPQGEFDPRYVFLLVKSNIS
jgi:thioredoxin-related protein